jgi:hypothetical protein
MNHQLTNANKKWRLTPLAPLSYLWPNRQLVTKAGQVFIQYGLWNIPTLLVMCRIKPLEEGCAEEIRDPCEVGAKTGPMSRHAYVRQSPESPKLTWFRRIRNSLGGGQMKALFSKKWLVNVALPRNTQCLLAMETSKHSHYYTWHYLKLTNMMDSVNLASSLQFWINM